MRIHPSFRSQTGCIPHTCERPLNAVAQYQGYHMSYNPRSADYGCDTTAIVLGNRVYLILNGEHTHALNDAAASNGLLGCMDYFIEHIAEANPRSEHRMVAGKEPDVFSLAPTVLKLIGYEYMQRLQQQAI